jgi:GNAT superfamily N-acetyltransferase
MQVGRPWRTDPRDLLLRPFEGTPADFGALAQVRNNTLQATTLPEDFEPMTAADIERYYNRGDFELTGNAWLLFHADQPAGAAVVYPPAIFPERPPGNFDMYVVPAVAHHGLGSRLLAHLEQAAHARGYPVLETTVAREDAPSTHFLSKRGFNVVGYSVHLVRNGMARIPVVDVPLGYSIRSLATLRETPDFYRDTTNRLGAYDPNYSLVRPEDIDLLAGTEAWQPEGIFFLFDPDGRIVGLIRSSGTPGGKGYLHEIRLEPASRGKGLGMAMLTTALHHLAAIGVSSTELDTLGENTPAHNLALKAGFEVARHWLHFLKPLRGLK